MATQAWVELGGGGGGSDSWKGVVATSGDLPAIGNTAGDARATADTGVVYVWDGGAWIAQSGGAIAGPFNQFVYFDGTGSLTNLPGFQQDTTSGGMAIGLTEQPDNGGGFTIHSISTSFEPLQNSPNENWNILNMSVSMDAASSGFSQGTAGNAVQLINGGFTHNGTGDVGGLVHINMSNSIGNGTDPISIGGVNYAACGGNINAGVTIENQLQGFGFNLSVNASAIMGASQNTQGFFDGCQIANTSNSHISFNASPNIAGIANNSNYTGLGIYPNITTFNGNASFAAVGSSPNITTTSATGGVVGFQFNPVITTMGATSYYHGLDIYGTITTSHGSVQGINIAQTITGGDADYTAINIGPNGAGTMNSITGINIALGGLNCAAQKIGLQVQGAKSTFSSEYFTDVLPPSPSFLDLNAIGSTYWVKPGFAVTGSLVFAQNNGQAAIFEDNMGPDGFGGFLGYVCQADVAQVVVATTKTVDYINISVLGASIPDATGYGITDGGTISSLTMALCLGALPSGGSAVITDMFGFKVTTPFGFFATNAWGFYNDSGSENYLDKLAISTTSQTVSSADVGLELGPQKAFMPGQFTTVQKLAITAIAGMVVYDTTLNQLSYYNGTTWINL